MPFFPSDVQAAVNEAANTSLSQRLFGNPFISAGLMTVCVFIVLVLMSSTIDLKEVARISLVIYVLGLALLFFNNTVLMSHLSMMHERDIEITPVRDFDNIHRSNAPVTGSFEANSGLFGGGSASHINYTEDFLDS